ncbi:UNKNOWN [Stylonychia lemnae]|uniref:Uncharacterized protein n=1 Tax=Stylonychia lemnae TaxID=5949 RepID=A0A078B872_STYLE|nr:UNKNOWN [Stylonychia lemnae]|eukprot:CDW89768.1 UNKNOWN [Stylonychia lemnae]
MHTSFKNHHTFNFRYKQVYFMLCFLSLLVTNTYGQGSCTDSKSTPYSGYLDTRLFYGSFKRDLNSSITIRNPYSGQLNLTQATVMFWAKLPALSNDTTLQRGRFFECNNTFSGRLDNNSLQLNVSQNFNFTNGTVNSTVIRQTLNVRQFNSSLAGLLEWNHYSFSFRDRRMRIHFNGLQISEVLMNYTTINTTRNTDICVIGNSINHTDPLHAFMRYFAMLSSGLASNTSLELRMRSVFLPSESVVLVYFKFDKYFNRQETYINNSTRQIRIQNFTIENSIEPESVCYCTQNTPSTFLRLNQSFLLDEIQLPKLNDTFQRILTNGFTFQIWLFPLNVSSTLKNMSIYTFVVTMNQSILFVDGVEVQRINANLTGFIAYIDEPSVNIKLGENLDSLVYKVALLINPQEVPDNISAQILNSYANHTQNQISQISANFTYILNLQLTRDQLIHDRSFASDSRLVTFDQVRGAYFVQSYQVDDLNYTVNITSINIFSAFKFEQNNMLCTSQTPNSVQALWDGYACKSQSYSPMFQVLKPPVNSLSDQANTEQSSNQQQQQQLLNPYLSTQISGNFSQMTIDLWFKLNYQNISSILYQDQTIIGMYPNKSTSNLSSDKSFKVYMNIQDSYDESMNLTSSNYKVICENSVFFDSQKFQIQIQNAQIIANNTWIHLAENIDATQLQTSGQLIAYSLALKNEESNNAQYPKSQISDVQSFDIFIGSDIQNMEQFGGLIRELRIFNSSLNFNQVRSLRFQKLPVTYQNKLVTQYSFENGYQDMIFNSATPNTQANINQLAHYYVDAKKYVWQNESQLIICGQGYLFNGQCCSLVAFLPQLSFKENNETVFVNSTLGKESFYDATSNFTWRLVSVIPNNTFYQNILNSTLVLQRTNQNLVFNKSAIYRNSTFVVEVQIQNIFQNQVAVQRIGITIQCPLVRMNYTQNPIIHPWGYVRKLAVQALLLNDCYNNSLTVKQILWANSTTGSLGNPFTLSTDKMIVTYSNETRVRNNSDMWLNLSVQFSNNQFVNDTRIVRFLSQPVVLSVNPEQFYLLNGQPLSFNVSQTQFLVNTVNRTQQGYQINCTNRFNFKNSTRSCSIDQNTGLFGLSNIDLVDPIIAYLDYPFNISAGISGTSLLAQKQISAKWYNLGQGTDNCPGVEVVDYFNVSKNNLTTQLHTPKVILDCLLDDQVTQKRYSRVNVTNEFDQPTLDLYKVIYNLTLGVSNFNQTFELLNDNYTFRFRNNNTIIQRIRVGDLIPINMTMHILDLGSENKTIIKYTKILNVNVLFSDLVVISNITSDKNGYIAFDQELIIDASLSYDPAFNISATQTNTSMLTYLYYCNNQPCPLNANQMNKGVLRLTIVDAIKLGYYYNTPYNFSIAINNPLIFRQALMYANYTVRFSPPNKIGTHTCPRIFYYRQNTTNTTIRQTNYTFNTLNVTDQEIKVGYENCDTLAYTPQLMIIDFPAKQLYSAYSKQLSSRAFNQSIFQLQSQLLLNNIELLESQIVKSTLFFNYTLNRLQKIGYSTTEFQINRTFSRLIPKTIPNSADNKVQISFEDPIAIDSSQSYDPDQPYIQKNYQDFTIVRNCSQNIQQLCNQLDQIKTFELNKNLRKQYNIQAVGSTFWISLRLVAQNRTSQVENITYEVIKQDYLKCLTVKDLYSNIVINRDEMKMPITISPTAQSSCSYVFIIDKLEWSTNYSSQFWNSNKFFNYEAVISKAQMLLLPQDQTILLRVRAKYMVLENKIDTFYSLPFNYSIRIQLPEIKAQIDVNDQINTSDETSIITASLLNVPSNVSTRGMTCKFQCKFRKENSQECGSRDLCQFDYMPILKNFIINNSFAYSQYLIIVDISLDNTIYTTKKVVSIRSSEIAPKCSIEIKKNRDIEIDKQTIFSASCSNYNVSALQYFWYLDAFDGGSVMNDIQSQSIKLKENALLNLQGLDPILQVKTELTKLTAHDCLSSYMLSIPSNDNIVLGSLNVDAKNVVFRRQIQKVEFKNYTDQMGGDLLFTLKYQTKAQKNYTLISKTSMKELYVIIPECQYLYLNVYDNKGSLKIQSFDMSFGKSLATSQLQFVEFYNDLQMSMDLDINQQSSFLGKTPEIFMNMVEQSIYLFIECYDQLDSEMIHYYELDIYQKLKDLVQLSNIYNGISDSKINTLVTMVRALDLLINDKSQAFLTLKSSNIYQFLTQNIDLEMLSLSKNENQEVNMQFYSILQSIKPYLNMTASQWVDFNQTISDSYSFINQNLMNGEVLILDSQNTTVKKIIKQELAQNEIEFSAFGVEIQINQNDLNDIDAPEMLISIQTKDDSLFQQYSNPNNTRISTIYDISLTDMSANKLVVQNKSLVIAFNNIDTKSHKNIKCAYFDEDAMQWQLDSQGELVTQVVEQENQVYCQTNHLTVFTVFNVTIDSGPINIPNDPNKPSQDGKNKDSKANEQVIISLIQIAIILAAFIILTISAKFEHQKTLIFRQNDYSQLQKRLSLKVIFTNFASILVLLKSERVNCFARFLIFINYLLVISFWTLVNLAVYRNHRTLGDEIFVIITNICIITFLSPITRQILVYKFYEFIPIKQFSSIPQQQDKSLIKPQQNINHTGNNRPQIKIDEDLNQINLKLDNQIPASTSSNLKKSNNNKGYQSQQLHTSSNLIMNLSDSPIGAVDAEKINRGDELTTSKLKDKTAAVTIEDDRTQGNQYRSQRYKPSGLINMDETEQNLKQPEFEIDFENESNCFDKLGNPLQSKSRRSSLIAIDLISSEEGDQPLGFSDRNIMQLALNFNAHSMSKQKQDKISDNEEDEEDEYEEDEQEFQFEGGSDEENNGPSLSGNRLHNQDAGSRSHKYQMNDGNANNVISNGYQENKFQGYEEKIIVKQVQIALVQIVSLLVLIALNAYLFYNVNIAEENSVVKSYIAVIIVSVIAQFVIIDFLISFIASYYIKKVALKDLSQCQSIIVFTFITVNRIRAL